MLAIPFSVTFLALALYPRRDDHDSPPNECAGKARDKERRNVPHGRSQAPHAGVKEAPAMTGGQERIAIGKTRIPRKTRKRSSDNVQKRGLSFGGWYGHHPLKIVVRISNKLLVYRERAIRCMCANGLHAAAACGLLRDLRGHQHQANAASR